MRLLRRKAAPIAIDCGSYALRAIQLGGDRDHPEVIGAACHVYSSDPGTGTTSLLGDKERLDETVEALHSFMTRKVFKGKRAISALGEKDLQIRNIRLPRLPETELSSAVKFAAAERFQGLGDDAEVRSFIAGTVVGEDDVQQEIIVLAAKEPVVRQHLDMLTKVGLESVGIDATPITMFRPFERYLRRSADQEQINVFVDIGWSGTRIVITRGDHIAFARTFGVGGAAFNRLVSRQLSLDLEEAGKIRRQAEAMHASKAEPTSAVDPSTMKSVDSAIQPAWEKLGKEIGLCLRYYAVTFRGAQAQSVTCVGGESMNDHYLQTLSDVTGLRCRVGFPLRNVANTDALPVEDADGPLADWTIAAGLAIERRPCGVGKVA